MVSNRDGGLNVRRWQGEYPNRLTASRWSRRDQTLAQMALAWTLTLIFPLAIWTRYFYERRKVALNDVRVFFSLGSRAKLKALLLVQAERIGKELDDLVEEYRPRVQAAG